MSYRYSPLLKQKPQRPIRTLPSELQPQHMNFMGYKILIISKRECTIPLASSRDIVLKETRMRTASRNEISLVCMSGRSTHTGM